MNSNQSIAIIGAGAAGIFAAINCARFNPNNRVVVFEKSNKLLSKVKISGGGRCNVTHACFEPKELLKNYPRGDKNLLAAFSEFGPNETVNWFKNRGVNLKAEADGRIFPSTDNSQTIIDCLLLEAQKYQVEIKKEKHLSSIDNQQNQFKLFFKDGESFNCHKLLIAVGGHPSLSSYSFISDLGHEIKSPVPSLFTFNLSEKSLSRLMGISLDTASVKLSGMKYVSKGPLLITHWGLSGPAVLKLSAYAARNLSELKYNYGVNINWIPEFSEEQCREYIQKFRNEQGSKLISGKQPFSIPKRLWEYFLQKSQINFDLKWSELPKKNQNKLITNLVSDTYQANGKTTFKEEFVTCGGVSNDEIDFKTMQSKICPNLYFAGEVLDVDGITGGFNFQAAWTTAWIAAKSMAV